jgi:EAL domain-containing protein (putative c-di-GMP-specific phosphodiesterase class I)
MGAALRLVRLTASTGLGAGLGMATTGEGVETRSEADYLRGEGCTEAQGYFFSRPKPTSEIRILFGGEQNSPLPAVAWRWREPWSCVSL